MLGSCPVRSLRVQSGSHAVLEWLRKDVRIVRPAFWVLAETITEAGLLLRDSSDNTVQGKLEVTDGGVVASS
jgi:hypothetical protein